MIDVKCECCSAPLKRHASQLKAMKYGPFCERHCLGKFRTKHLVGEFAANYKIGSRKSRNYIEVEARWHPNANKKGYIFLHRLISEAMLGRFLTEDEVVHHKDHDQRNNHWSNLEVLTQAEHALLHKHERNERGQFISDKERNEASDNEPQG